ncbi:helix-turn-helix domain-containing transcriptional regulator [Spongorhabdus nitratireducens]
MDKRLSDFDPAEFLDSQEKIENYLKEALETGDADFIADSLSVIARAKLINALKEGEKSGVCEKSPEEMIKKILEDKNDSS